MSPVFAVRSVFMSGTLLPSPFSSREVDSHLVVYATQFHLQVELTKRTRVNGNQLVSAVLATLKPTQWRTIVAFFSLQCF